MPTQTNTSTLTAQDAGLLNDAAISLSVAFEHSEVDREDFRRLRTAKAVKAGAPLTGEKLETACRNTRKAALEAVLAKHPSTSQEDIEAAVDAELYAPPPPVFGSQMEPLGVLMREGIPEVEYLLSPSLGERLFYAKCLLKLDGHAKHGKSWMLTLLSADQIRAGRPVLYVDQEQGREIFAERLLLLGLDPEQVDQHFRYEPFPVTIPGIANLRGDLERMARTNPGTLLIIDSMRSYMTRYKLNPNVEVDVEAFLGSLMGAVKNCDAGLTVIVIDHSNRQTKAADKYSAAGSAAKAAAVDAIYYFDREEYFSEERQGLVKLSVNNDRRGRLRDTERYYRVGGQGEGKPIAFQRVDRDEVGVNGRIRDDIVAFLSDSEGERFSARQIEKAVKGDATTIRGLLPKVESATPHVHRERNPKNAKGWLYFYDAGGLSLDGAPVVPGGALE